MGEKIGRAHSRLGGGRAAEASKSKFCLKEVPKKSHGRISELWRRLAYLFESREQRRRNDVQQVVVSVVDLDHKEKISVAPLAKEVSDEILQGDGRRVLERCKPAYRRYGAVQGLAACLLRVRP